MQALAQRRAIISAIGRKRERVIPVEAVGFIKPGFISRQDVRPDGLQLQVKLCLQRLPVRRAPDRAGYGLPEMASNSDNVSHAPESPEDF